MKFKKIIIATTTILLLSQTSCMDDLLNQENPNQLTVDSFWKTDKDALEATISCYAGLQEEGTWKRWMDANYVNRSDEGRSSSTWIEYSNWSKFIYSDYNWAIIAETWQDHYRSIFRPNQVLKYVPGIEMDENLKKQYIAEAKFVRAFLYFDIVTLWGNASLWLEASSADDLPPYSTEAEIWTQIEKDLTEAIPDLPTSYDDQSRGRATRYAGHAMLAKVLMQQRKWAAAKPHLAEIIAVAPATYDLMADYKDNFRSTAENNKESIWEIQFSDQFDGWFWDKDLPATSEGSRRSVYFSPRTVGGNQDNQPTQWVFQQFSLETTVDDEADPRQNATFIYNTPGTWFGKTYAQLSPVNPNEVWFRKNNNDETLTNVNEHSPNNQRIIRLADVYLLYAEVLNELGDTDEAYAFINKVRTRSNMANLEVAKPNLTQQQMRDQLDHERVMELTGENVRWNDLKRWGLLDTQAGIDILKARDPEFNTFNVGQHQFLPLPQNEIDLNPNFKGKQNLNY